MLKSLFECLILSIRQAYFIATLCQYTIRASLFHRWPADLCDKWMNGQFAVKKLRLVVCVIKPTRV